MFPLLLSKIAEFSAIWQQGVAAGGFAAGEEHGAPNLKSQGEVGWRSVLEARWRNGGGAYSNSTILKFSLTSEVQSYHLS